MALDFLLASLFIRAVSVSADSAVLHVVLVFVFPTQDVAGAWMPISCMDAPETDSNHSRDGAGGAGGVSSELAYHDFSLLAGEQPVYVTLAVRFMGDTWEGEEVPRSGRAAASERASCRRHGRSGVLFFLVYLVTTQTGKVLT